MTYNVPDILSSVLRRNNSSSIKALFELLTQNRTDLQLIKSQRHPDDYILSIDDYPIMTDNSDDYRETGDCYLLYCPSEQMIQYHNGDPADGYILDIPCTKSTGNLITPSVGEYIQYTTSFNKKYYGRVKRIDGDMVIINKWDGHGFETRSWYNTAGDVQETYETAIPIDACECAEKFLDQVRKVNPRYIFVKADSIICHELDETDVQYLNFDSIDYTRATLTAREIWNAYYAAIYGWLFEELTYVGFIYSSFTYAPIGKAFHDWEPDLYHDVYEYRSGSIIKESTPHICYRGYLSESLKKKIIKNLGNIIFDPRYTRDKAQALLISDLLQ